MEFLARLFGSQPAAQMPAQCDASAAHGCTHAQSDKAQSQKPYVSPALVTLSSWSWRALVTAAAAAVGIWLLMKFSVMVIAILVALLLAVVTQPLAGFLRDKWHWPSALAAGTTLLLVLLFLIALLVGSGTGLYQGFSEVGDKIQAGIERIILWVNDSFPQAQDKVDQAWAEAQNFLKNNAGNIFGGVMAFSSSMTTFITSTVLVIFSLFFFLKDGRGLWQWFVRLWPERYRTQTNEAGIRAWVTLGNYARTQAIVALVDAILISIVAAILGTPFSLVFPIGAIVFICAFIPVVGALLSGAVAVLVVLVVTGDWVMALAMLIGVLLVQQIEGNVLSPLLQGNALNLHAWAILLLVMGGSMIAGIFGALFTVPLAAAVNTMILYLRGHDTYPYLNTMPNRPGGPRKDFEEYAKGHWQKFDDEVAQKLSPSDARRAKREARKAKRAQSKAKSAPASH